MNAFQCNLFVFFINSKQQNCSTNPMLKTTISALCNSDDSMRLTYQCIRCEEMCSICLYLYYV